MIYADLQNKNIEDLNERVETLGFSVRSISKSIAELKSQMGKDMVEHELASFNFQKKLEQSCNALHELTLQEDLERKELEKAHTILDNSRFDAFRDDRGESVESLPIGPLAIVPLGSSGVMPPNAEWTDKDAYIIHGSCKGNMSNIEFKECHHKRFEGPFIKWGGTYTCNNCKTSELACYECKKELKD